MKRARTPRMRKVNELIREVVADEIATLKDPRVGFVTITGVDTSPDLRHAVVYYSVLGSEEEAAETAEALTHAAPHLQRIVGSQTRLKYTPRLEFAVDPSIAQGVRIDQLLREAGGDEDRDG